jgi:hypothetical protein
VGVPPGLVKSDVDAAFRRVPVKQEHRWACGIAFKAKDKVRFGCECQASFMPRVMRWGRQVWAAVHVACPFGAVGSVHGWERYVSLLVPECGWQFVWFQAGCRNMFYCKGVFEATTTPVRG